MLKQEVQSLKTKLLTNEGHITDLIQGAEALQENFDSIGSSNATLIAKNITLKKSK